MTRMQTLMTRFAEDESGAALAEYAVTFLVIAAVSTALLTGLGEKLSLAFEGIGNWVADNITAKFE
jgi:Flp pilus assembly pilin Flp